MWRRLFNLAAAVSLVLCLAIIALSIHSYSYGARVGWNGMGDVYWLLVHWPGELEVRRLHSRGVEIPLEWSVHRPGWLHMPCIIMGALRRGPVRARTRIEAGA